MCCSSKLHKFHHTSSCCGNETYDVREKYCFQDRLIIGLWESKCGDNIYNTSEYMCCNKTLIPHKYSHRCCGSLSYDPSNNDCVGNHVVQKGHRWCPNRMCCQRYSLNKLNEDHIWKNVLKTKHLFSYKNILILLCRWCVWCQDTWLLWRSSTEKKRTILALLWK